jgi:hypothetical protein
MSPEIENKHFSFEAIQKLIIPYTDCQLKYLEVKSTIDDFIDPAPEGIGIHDRFICVVESIEFEPERVRRERVVVSVFGILINRHMRHFCVYKRVSYKESDKEP